MYQLNHRWLILIVVTIHNSQLTTSWLMINDNGGICITHEAREKAIDGYQRLALQQNFFFSCLAITIRIDVSTPLHNSHNHNYSDYIFNVRTTFMNKRNGICSP